MEPMFMRMASSTRSTPGNDSRTPDDLRIVLLHGHNFLDVFDVLLQPIQFFQIVRLFAGQMLGQLRQIIRATVCLWDRW